jgi:starch synthase (maltosyl-transferring)
MNPSSSSPPKSAPSRVVIEGVDPEIDGGRFPVKRTVGEDVEVQADIYADGHDVLAAVLLYRHVPPGAKAQAPRWTEVPLQALSNDRWSAKFTTAALGTYYYTLQAWVDRFGTWRKELSKKAEAGQDVASELLEGADLLTQAARGGSAGEAEWLGVQVAALRRDADQAVRVKTALDPALADLMARLADRGRGTTYDRILRVAVEQERARYGAWYEMFPRSCADEPGRHGTFKDCEKRLPYVAGMGFDVLYLPPIHPIGRSFRKGPNNTLQAGADDPGSPWAIGGKEGGHKAVHPALGTLAEFDHLVAAARDRGIDIAMDVAFQCSPDHPYVREHPEWFRHRPDGSIKYAENPPKKYQDIYPIDFDCADWQALWNELRDVVLFWAGRGVRIFRVDNPHTKPFSFWEWLIAQVRERHPDAVFLSEAFTRPKIMRRLAKCGFSQSYSYFTWRNTGPEIAAYFTELTQTQVREYMRPNLFANTPDILPEFLWNQGVSAFRLRLVLAATLGASYGVYGPPFEMCESRPLGQGEEYFESEKYQLRRWDWDRPNVFREFITQVNRIRRDNAALHYDHRLRFHPTDNENLLFYSKSLPDLSNVLLMVVNVDPHHVQSGWVRVPTAELGLEAQSSYQVHDLLTDARFLWQGDSNFVSLDPAVCPAHILRLRKRVKTERDFDYFQ